MVLHHGGQHFQVHVKEQRAVMQDPLLMDMLGVAGDFQALNDKIVTAVEFGRYGQGVEIVEDRTGIGGKVDVFLSAVDLDEGEIDVSQVMVDGAAARDAAKSGLISESVFWFLPTMMALWLRHNMKQSSSAFFNRYSSAARLKAGSVSVRVKQYMSRSYGKRVAVPLQLATSVPFFQSA